MPKYHLNYKGEAGRCSASAGKCPFGGENDHFATPEIARDAYEAAQAAFSSPVKRTPAASTPPGKYVNVLEDLDLTVSDVKLEAHKTRIFQKPFDSMTDADHLAIAAIVSEQERRRNADNPQRLKKANSGTASWAEGKTPDPADSKIIAPPTHNDNEGYMGGHRWRGGKVQDRDAAGRLQYLSQKDAAKLIRADIKEALKIGELPKDLTYNVRMASGAWVTSIDIYLGVKNDEGKPSEVNEIDQGDSKMIAVKRYLDALGNQYSTDDSNSQFDYFNSNNRARVSFWSKYY